MITWSDYAEAKGAEEENCVGEAVEEGGYEVVDAVRLWRFEAACKGGAWHGCNSWLKDLATGCDASGGQISEAQATAAMVVYDGIYDPA